MIDSTSSSLAASGPSALPLDVSKAGVARSGMGSDRLSMEKAERLRAALARDPEIRSEMVAKGRALAADSSYPSTGVIRKVAGMIVQAPDLSEDLS